MVRCGAGGWAIATDAMDVPTKYAPFAVAAAVGLAGLIPSDWSLMLWLLAAAIACGGVIREDPRWGILGTSVLGLGSSAYLFTRKLASATGPSLCNVSETINCDVLNNSPASEVMGIPIALLGSGFFLGVAIASVAARDARARLYASTTILAAVGVLYSVYLAGVAYTLGAVCVMCITIYLCTGLLVWAGLRGLHANGEALPQVMSEVPTSQSFVAIVATFLVVVLLGLSTWSGTEEDNPALPEITGEATEATKPPGDAPDATENSQPDALATRDDNTLADAELAEQVAQLFTTARGPVALSGSEPVLGDPNAPYLVVEFADFGCPHCAQAAVQLKQLVQQVPDIQVRFRPFPLSGACNPLLEGEERIDRCRAAIAAECANRQGKFWEYAAVVFANHHDLSDAMLTSAMRQVGLDEAAFSTCMQDPEAVRSVAESAVAGGRAGVQGTPTLFIKGLDGDQWHDVCAGAEGVLGLVNLHQNGVKLPEPAQQSCF